MSCNLLKLDMKCRAIVMEVISVRVYVHLIRSWGLGVTSAVAAGARGLHLKECHWSASLLILDLRHTPPQRVCCSVSYKALLSYSSPAGVVERCGEGQGSVRFRLDLGLSVGCSPCVATS